MGMSADEFWNGEPCLAVAYRKAQELRNEQSNDHAWWQGLYIYDAIYTITQNILRKKGQRPKTYPQEPYQLGKKTDAEKNELQKRERKKAIAYFDDLKQRLEKKYGR